MQESFSLILHYQHITVDLFLWPERKSNEILLLPTCAYVLYGYKGEHDANFSKYYENAHCFFFLKNVNLPFP